MGLTDQQVLAGLALIRERLRPFVAVETPPDTAVPTADVFLYRKADGSVEVEIPASAWFGLSVADLSAGLPPSSEARQWLAEHELAAQRLMYQIDPRASALLRITECAVAHQKDFLDHSTGHHKPLTRTAVPQEIGLHCRNSLRLHPAGCRMKSSVMSWPGRASRSRGGQ